VTFLPRPHVDQTSSLRKRRCLRDSHSLSQDSTACGAYAQLPALVMDDATDDVAKNVSGAWGDSNHSLFLSGLASRMAAPSRKQEPTARTRECRQEARFLCWLGVVDRFRTPLAI